MHPSIALMLRSHQNRAIAAHILARLGNRGDTMLAHINPAEALVLKRLGGAGTLNPKTGLRQFYPGAGGAGGMGLGGSGGEAGSDPGGRGNGGNGQGGGGGYGGRPTGPHDAAGYSAGGGYAPGNANGGYDGQGRGATMAPGGGLVGGDLPNDGSTRIGESAFHAATNDYNGSLLGQIFGAKPTLTNSASYADGTWHTGFNPGAVAGGVIGTVAGIPGLGLLTGGLYHAIGGGDVVLGGPGAPATEGMEKGMGFGPNPYVGSSGGAGSMGNAGANAGGQHDGRSRGGQPSSIPPSTNPVPGAQPAGLPPTANPALAGLYFGGLAGDHFAARFGTNPQLSPYLIAANQPAAPGYLSGLWR